MTTQPVIVVLDDERPQLLALRAALHGLGDIKDFAEPTPALDFMLHHVADVAIIDIHMPRFRTNGLDLIQAVRQFDHDLCVIIRTADDTTELADRAIEVRAFRRAIKAKTTIAELRELTRAAMAETRERRQVTLNAAATAEVKTQLAQTLGSVEDELSVTDSYKGLFQTMRNQLTAVAAVAEVLSEAARRDGGTFLKDHALKNKILIGGLLTGVNTFLDGPFAESLRAARPQRRGTVNGVLETLQKRFLAAPQWIAAQKLLNTTGLSQDMFVAVPPLKLVTALRHLVEFCLQRSPGNSVLRLTAHWIENAKEMISAERETALVFNRRLLSHSNQHIVFRLCAPLIDTPLETIRQSLVEYPEDPRAGNLQMIGLALGDEQTALVINRSPGEITMFELYLPVGR